MRFVLCDFCVIQLYDCGKTTLYQAFCCLTEYDKFWCFLYVSCFKFTFAIKLLQPHVFIWVMQVHIRKLNLQKLSLQKIFWWNSKITMTFTLACISKHSLKHSITIHTKSDRLKQNLVLMLMLRDENYLLYTKRHQIMR